MNKSTPREIQERFDREVERFSNLQTGQSATIDAPLVLELIAAAASAATPHARALLDVGCGAGNYTLKLLTTLSDLDVTLVDLSAVMLDRAVARIGAAGAGAITPLQGNISDLPLPSHAFDIIVAGAVLHHLRDDRQWESTFASLYQSLRPGGSIWISDLVSHESDAVQQMMRRRYGQYLSSLEDDAYRDEVFAYIEREDTPRPLTYQLNLLRRVGFERIDVLHKNGPFAAFGAIKSIER